MAEYKSLAQVEPEYSLEIELARLWANLVRQKEIEEEQERLAFERIELEKKQDDQTDLAINLALEVGGRANGISADDYRERIFDVVTSMAIEMSSTRRDSMVVAVGRILTSIIGKSSFSRYLPLIIGQSISGREMDSYNNWANIVVQDSRTRGVNMAIGLDGVRLVYEPTDEPGRKAIRKSMVGKEFEGRPVDTVAVQVISMSEDRLPTMRPFILVEPNYPAFGPYRIAELDKQFPSAVMKPMMQILQGGMICLPSQLGKEVIRPWE